MKKEEFYSLQMGALVTCFKEDWDMNFGWEDEMSEMVGLHLPIIDKTKTGEGWLGLILENPETGNQYTFDYRLINVVIEKKYSSFTSNGFKYYQRIQISLADLSNYTLNQDYNCLKKIYKNKRYLVVDLEKYTTIKKHCPRIIGVLLGNNFLTKTKVI